MLLFFRRILFFVRYFFAFSSKSSAIFGIRNGMAIFRDCNFRYRHELTKNFAENIGIWWFLPFSVVYAHFSKPILRDSHLFSVKKIRNDNILRFHRAVFFSSHLVRRSKSVQQCFKCMLTLNIFKFDFIFENRIECRTVQFLLFGARWFKQRKHVPLAHVIDSTISSYVFFPLSLLSIFFLSQPHSIQEISIIGFTDPTHSVVYKTAKITALRTHFYCCQVIF